MDIEELKRLLVPTRAWVGGFFGVGLFILGSIYWSLIFRRFLQGDVLADPFREFSVQQLDRLSQLHGSSLAVRLIFWVLIGLAAYVVFLFLNNLVIEIRNEIVVGAKYTNKGKLAQRVRPPLLRLGTVVAAATVLWLNVEFILPNWLSFFERFMEQAPRLTAFGWLILAATGMASSVYLFWGTIRLARAS